MSIEAMKQALEALESWQKTCLDCGRGSEELGRATQPITALRQAIAEAEKQEPVAWMWKDGTLTSDPDFADGTWTPLFAAPVHASDISQEPVDETAKDRHVSYVCPNCYWSLDKQVESKWVGLTDDEIHEVVSKKWWDWEDAFDIEGFSRAIEAKLKEKNSG